MEKLKMLTPNLVNGNIEKIKKIFPDCITEHIRGGQTWFAVDFDKLRQQLSGSVIEGDEERYQFTWPGKKQSIITANAPISKTLRPCREESVDFDNTENLYIEGDNLDVLKLLREDYLGKVKMIYIDPPYNTGNDFIYEDNFVNSVDDYIQNSGQVDDEGNRLAANTESNGRFHTDWLNMIYPRLKVARDLLSEDGVIFISIDDNELENLKKICNEIFGESNFRNIIQCRRQDKNLNRQFMNQGLKTMNVGLEFILVYARSPDFMMSPVFRKSSEERATEGYWKGFWNGPDRPTMRYDILGYTPTTGQWKWSKEEAEKAVANYKLYQSKYSDQMSLEEYWNKTGRKLKFIRRNMNGSGKNMGVESWIAPTDSILRTSNWSDLLISKSSSSVQFNNPKNSEVIKLLIQLSGAAEDDIVLDFFSGSGTTAVALLEENAESEKQSHFILVQIPEKCSEDSVAWSQGFTNICEIGKERIRLAGKKILEEQRASQADGMYNAQIQKLDIGFRVLKLDSSNMKDVYYKPSDVTNDLFARTEDNIKEDRTDEDLLFQVMLELAVPLSAKIRPEEICGRKVMVVDDNYLIACFDRDITDEVVTDIAKRKPQYFVMRDSSAMDDSVITNFETIFQTYSKDTVRKIL